MLKKKLSRTVVLFCILALQHVQLFWTFVNSFMKFISRRGCPQKVLSDNGTVFKSELTPAFASERNIAWNFSITEAPWYGGFWERLVSMVKRCIKKKTIGRTSLTFVELQTLLFEVESTLNSGPLGVLYDDDFEEVLTPHHLLFGRNLETSNTRDAPLNVDIPTSKRVQSIQTFVNYFWSRWRNEYLTSLRERQRDYKRKNAIIANVDDIVLIQEEKQPRQCWRLGRIVEIIAGT